MLDSFKNWIALSASPPRNDENQRSRLLSAHSHPLKFLNHALNQIQPHLPKGGVGCIQPKGFEQLRMVLCASFTLSLSLRPIIPNPPC
jgi:hypothetical protein